MDKEDIQKELLYKYNPYKIITLMLKRGEQVQTPLYGYCMRPVIDDGDTVIIAPIKLDKLVCGDIVVYQNEDKLKIHRLLGFSKKTGEKCLITKGDKCITIDPPASSSLYLGKVTTVQKKDKVLKLDSMKWKIINYSIGKLTQPLMFLTNLFKRIKRVVKRIVKYFLKLTFSKFHFFY